MKEKFPTKLSLNCIRVMLHALLESGQFERRLPLQLQN